MKKYRSFDSVYVVKVQRLSVVLVKLMGNLEREKTREIATEINKISLKEEDFPGESLQWKMLPKIFMQCTTLHTELLKTVFSV